MSIAVWIVLAFLLGVAFGRMTARSSAGRPSGAGSAASPAIHAVHATFTPTLGSPAGAYRIVLLDSGPNKINSIKAVREVTRLDLKGAKDLVDAAPCELTRVELLSQAEQIAARFQDVATVRVEGPAIPQSAEIGAVPQTSV